MSRDEIEKIIFELMKLSHVLKDTKFDSYTKTCREASILIVTEILDKKGADDEQT